MNSVSAVVVRRWISTSGASRCAAIRRECVGGVCRLDDVPGRQLPAPRAAHSVSAVLGGCGGGGVSSRKRSLSDGDRRWSKLAAVMENARRSSASESESAPAAAVGDEAEVRRRMEEISHKFSEALEMIEDAKDSLGTVYFSEDVNDAKRLIEEVLASYHSLLDESDEARKAKIQASIGLKIQEMKARRTMLDDMIREQ